MPGTIPKLVLCCAISSMAFAASADTIHLGSVSHLTGPVIFDEPSRAAQAVFNRVNEQGGIHGSMIEYHVEDDRFDPAAAAQSARRLVDELQVVGNVGSASVIECAVNNAFYTRSGLISVSGLGVDPSCFESPSIVPVNNGPYKGTEVLLTYLSEQAGAERICGISNDVPVQNPGYRAAIKRWTAATGNEIVSYVDSLAMEEDTLPYIMQAVDAGCDAIVYTGVEPQIVALMRGVEAQNITGVTFAFLATGYTEAMPAALGDIGEGIIALAEFSPYTVQDPETEDWLSLMSVSDIPASAFAQAGYVAANMAVAALESIEGDITRASFAEAVRGMTDYHSPLVGNPISVGDGDAHNPNYSSRVMTIRDGQWVAASDWVSAP